MDENMKSIMMTYPDFIRLPRGIKQMLVASESLFFAEVGARTKRPAREALTIPVSFKRELTFESASRFPAWNNTRRN
jgi:hypothetical protein